MNRYTKPHKQGFAVQLRYDGRMDPLEYSKLIRQRNPRLVTKERKAK